jgi:DNA-binding transcriptional ArsR family regulator
MNAAAVVDDELWSAIGDPTRRTMIDLLLAEGPGTATSLSARVPVTRQAVSKHLAVLDRVGLVRVETAGRERRYRVDDEQLGRAVAQLSAVGATWDRRLRRIKEIAERIERTRPASDGALPNQRPDQPPNQSPNQEPPEQRGA